MNKCIICFENKNLIKICKCNYYIHQKCFDEWYLINTNNCLMCKKNINISCYKKFIKFFNLLLHEMNEMFEFLSEYNLYSLTRWNDY